MFGELVQQAASAGSADALFALGGAFFHGEDGFARDPRAAFRCGAVFRCVSFSFFSLSKKGIRSFQLTFYVIEWPHPSVV